MKSNDVLHSTIALQMYRRFKLKEVQVNEVNIRLALVEQMLPRQLKYGPLIGKDGFAPGPKCVLFDSEDIFEYCNQGDFTKTD